MIRAPWSRGLLRGGLVGAAALMTPTLLLAFAISGRPGLVSAVLTGSTLLLFFAVGQFVEALCLQRADWGAFMVMMGSFLMRVVILGVVLWQLVSAPVMVDRSQQVWAFVAACACVFGWIGGVVWAHAHQRLPIYDTEYLAPADWQERS